MNHEEMFQAALSRPRNYLSRSAREQWEIDKDLGILDWDGPKTEDEYNQLAKHLGMKRP